MFKLSDLIGQRTLVEQEIASQKAVLDDLNAQIEAMAKPYYEAAYTRLGKPDGTARFALGNEIYKVEIPKTIMYDNHALQILAGEMPFEDATKLFRITITVPETAFKMLTDESVKLRILNARTVKYGKPKITRAE